MQQLPPPPPPPPTVPSSVSTHQTPVYKVTNTRPTTSYTMGKPPPVFPVFDASRPPPSIPTNSQKLDPLKRKMSNDSQGSTCKMRKTDEPTSDAQCDMCVQRELSIEEYKKYMEKIRAEDENQTVLLKKKQIEYQRQKELLRCLVDRDLFRQVEELIEDVPKYNFRSALNESILTGPTSSISKQMVLQFMEYVLSNSSKSSSFESLQPDREDHLQQMLSSMSSPRSPLSSDILQTLQNICFNSTISPAPSPKSSPKSSDNSPGGNGVSSYGRYPTERRVEHRENYSPAQPPVPVQHPGTPRPPQARIDPSTSYPQPHGFYPSPYLTPYSASQPRAPAPPGPPYGPELGAPRYYHYQ